MHVLGRLSQYLSGEGGGGVGLLSFHLTELLKVLGYEQDGLPRGDAASVGAEVVYLKDSPAGK